MQPEVWSAADAQVQGDDKVLASIDSVWIKEDKNPTFVLLGNILKKRNRVTNFLGQVVAFWLQPPKYPIHLRPMFLHKWKKSEVPNRIRIPQICFFRNWGSHQNTRWISTFSKEKMCIKYGNTAAKERSGCSIINRTLLHIANIVRHATRVARMFPAITNLWTQWPNGSLIVLWCKLRAMNEKELHGRAQ